MQTTGKAPPPVPIEGPHPPTPSPAHRERGSRLSPPTAYRLPPTGRWLLPTGYCLIVVVALALRLAFLFRAPVFIIGDSENYFWPGYELAREIGFDLEIRRTPVYPLFIT